MNDRQFDPKVVGVALKGAWSLKTAKQWTPDNPAAGQCNVTAIFVQQRYGGEILKTKLSDGLHYYNLIDGRRYDFTASQFSHVITYDDLSSSRSEASLGATEAELQELTAAFDRAIRPSGE